MSYSPFSTSSYLTPFAIQASNPMRMTVGAMYTYPFFLQTYDPAFKCAVKQPFQAICGSAEAMDLSCKKPRLPTVDYPIVFV